MSKPPPGPRVVGVLVALMFLGVVFVFLETALGRTPSTTAIAFVAAGIIVAAGLILIHGRPD